MNQSHEDSIHLSCDLCSCDKTAGARATETRQGDVIRPERSGGVLGRVGKGGCKVQRGCLLEGMRHTDLMPQRCNKALCTPDTLKTALQDACIKSSATGASFATDIMLSEHREAGVATSWSVWVRE